MLVVLQAHEAGRWRTFRTVRTKRKGGRFSTRYRFTSGRTGTFRIRNDRGTAFGTVDMDFVLDVPGNSITFTGTADFTGGKGRYKGIKGTDLKAYDHNTLDGQNGTIELKGFATY